MSGTALPEREAELDAADALYLRRAIELSALGRKNGNRPFGAVIVSRDGAVLAEAYNNSGETGDCTGHAETAAIRLASPRSTREVFAAATIYASGEPCVMCAGAIFWCNIGRVVFGIDAHRLRAFRGEYQDQRDVRLSCRDVFNSSGRSIEVVGPALVEEARLPHEGAWKP